MTNALVFFLLGLDGLIVAVGRSIVWLRKRRAGRKASGNAWVFTGIAAIVAVVSAVQVYDVETTPGGVQTASDLAALGAFVVTALVAIWLAAALQRSLRSIWAKAA